MAELAHGWTRELAGAMPPDWAAGDIAVLDAAYLARQCFGDIALEHELLQLFAAQARALCVVLHGMRGRPAAAADAAHRLKGAAAAVGAARVAAHAARLEALERGGAMAAPDEVAGLEQAVEDACVLIALRLAA